MRPVKKILITGASGFIGSFLVEKALEYGYETWAGIRKNSSKKYLQDKRIKFIDLNFSNTEKLTAQLLEFSIQHGSFDYIIHNAGVTKCVNENDFENINFQNTANLIDTLIKTNTIPLKFILISSLSVMGMGDEINNTPFSLDDNPQPNTAYGKSKLKAEKYLQTQNEIPYLIFRPTGVYGPRETDYFLMLKTIKSGLNVQAGLKPQYLTFIYVKDLADVIYLGLESTIANRTYFVADGDVYTDKEYTNLAKEIIGQKQTLNIRIPLWIIKIISTMTGTLAKITKKPSTLNPDKYKIMKQRNWICDTQALSKDLVFTAKYNLKKGLKESVEWYKKQEWL